MRSLLAVAALLAAVPMANAQDKAKSEFTHSGEFRARDSYMMNSAGMKDTDMNTANGRFKLDIGAKAGDKLSAGLTVLHNNTYGATASLPSPTDGLSVNQAFATWMASDDFTLKAGRMNYQVGDGTIMGLNDWEAIPYAYEGLMGNWEAEFGRFQLFMFKTAESFGTGPTSDPEGNMYGLNFDLKTMPEVIKGLNVHVIQSRTEIVTPAAATATTPAVTARDGAAQMRYGLNLNLAFGMIDLGAWYEAHSGKTVAQASGAKTDTEGNLMAVAVGANFANFMNSKLTVKYHKDSGNKAGATKTQLYDGFNTEKHASAGHMDLFGFGNLTFIQVGWTGKPMDSTEVGLNYWMFSQTEKNGGIVNGVNGSSFGTVATDKTKLGDEIDLWASHKYDNGLTTILRLGMFTPGDAFKELATKQDKSVTEVFVEGRFAF